MVSGRRALSRSAALRPTPATDRTPFATVRTRVSALTLALGRGYRRALGLGFTPTRAYPVHQPGNEEVTTLNPV